MLKLDGDGPVAMAQEVLASTSLAQFYEFTRVWPRAQGGGVKNKDGKVEKPLLSLDEEAVYPCRVSLSKKGRTLRPADPEAPAPYYTVGEWKTEKEARLYNMLRLMASLNKKCVYSVSLWAMDMAEMYENSLQGLMRSLRRASSFSAGRTGAGASVGRDENASTALKRMEKLMEELAGSPHFLANIQVMAEDEDLAGLLIDAAASEALQKGAYDLNWESGRFTAAGLHAGGFVPAAGRPAPPRELAHWPSIFLLEEAAAFAPLPALYPGERLEMPKETAPAPNPDGLYLGRDEGDHPVAIPLKNLSKHGFFAGIPGAGKTNTMMHMARELLVRHGIPVLIFEPAKQEYRAILKDPEVRAKGMTVFAPGSGTLFPLHINPFQFPAEMRLSEHIRNLVAVFEGAFYLEAPMPFLLDTSIEDVYRDKGWLPHTMNTPQGAYPYPTMSDLYKKLEENLNKTDYAPEVKSNLKSYIQVRIGSLLTREMGEVFDVAESTYSPEEWLVRPTLLELEAMGSGQANFLTLMLATLIRETLRVHPEHDKSRPRHVIFFEEAHNLIGPVAEEAGGKETNSKSAATAYIVKMLAEVRALGEAIFIADQLPTAMAPQVLKNTSLKLAHALTAQDERAAIGSTMSADGVQLERMATFPVGRSLCIYQGLLKPFEVQIAQYKGDNEPPKDGELIELLKNSPAYRRAMERSYKLTMNRTLMKEAGLTGEAALLESRIRVLNENGERVRQAAGRAMATGKAEDKALAEEARRRQEKDRREITEKAEAHFEQMAESVA
ncbi:MAG: ATP-binding protein, partial [Oscillospiraceae bacterium]|nr:ATP-binding protein [Oscillospiraceae bacterium]